MILPNHQTIIKKGFLWWQRLQRKLVSTCRGIINEHNEAIWYTGISSILPNEQTSEKLHIIFLYFLLQAYYVHCTAWYLYRESSLPILRRYQDWRVTWQICMLLKFFQVTNVVLLSDVYLYFPSTQPPKLLSRLSERPGDFQNINSDLKMFTAPVDVSKIFTEIFSPTFPVQWMGRH